jgi:hypothetical protein
MGVSLGGFIPPMVLLLVVVASVFVARGGCGRWRKRGGRNG